MAKAPDCLTHTTMTRTVNRIDAPNSFIRDMLFGRRVTYPTKEVEWGVISADREMAKFVREGSQARFVKQLQEDRELITFPNIREKKVMKANEGMFTRHVGNPIFAGRRQMISAYEAAVARELRDLSNRIFNREEEMCASALTGSLSYSEEDGAHFTITYGKPASHTFAVTAVGGNLVWSDASANPQDIFEEARELIDDEEGLPLTDAIMSKSAAQNFMKLEQVKKDLDRRQYENGELRPGQRIRADGAQFLGVYHETRCWVYRRKALQDGVATPLIRDDYVEFVAAVPEADTEMAFGAITDQSALEDGVLEAERFSKSWIAQDPGHRIALVESHPLPVMRRPGMVVSVDVLQ